MTKLAALQMVRHAMLHTTGFNNTDQFGNTIETLTDRTLMLAERGLEFEAFFEQGGIVRKVS